MGTYESAFTCNQILKAISVPIFAEVKVENGGEVKTETRQVGERNRFSCHLLEISFKEVLWLKQL